MATLSAKEIKNRIRSMESTKQITKAMEMVAASKLRHAQQKVLSTRPYFEILRNTISNIVDANTDLSSPYLQQRPVKKTAYLVIAGDRGLAGGYNSNVLKLIQSQIQGKNATVFPIGRKTVDYLRSHQIPMLTDSDSEASEVSIGDCFSIAKQLSLGYLSGRYDEIFLAYTNCISVLSQMPTIMRLLPLLPTKPSSAACDILCEPDATAVFEKIVPEYLGGILYGALCESRCAEQAARRTAMDSATQNAQDMITDLSLKFNQARQAAITQEITEIVAGS